MGIAFLLTEKKTPGLSSISLEEKFDYLQMVLLCTHALNVKSRAARQGKTHFVKWECLSSSQMIRQVILQDQYVRSICVHAL